MTKPTLRQWIDEMIEEMQRDQDTCNDYIRGATDGYTISKPSGNLHQDVLSVLVKDYFEFYGEDQDEDNEEQISSQAKHLANIFKDANEDNIKIKQEEGKAFIKDIVNHHEQELSQFLTTIENFYQLQLVLTEEES